MKFTGNRALILGGSCDLAITLAQCMIEAGLFPILTYRSEKGREYISENLKNCTKKYSSFYLEFGNHDSIDSLLQQIGDEIDFMVDFAQGNFESLVASADVDRIYSYFAENVSFRAEVVKRVARIMMKNKRGRLVFISSSAAVRPNPGQGFYAAAKLASEAIYKNLGLELGGHGITAITLRPGYIDSGRGGRFIRAHTHEVLNKVPIKRALTKKEVAETILFYLSDSATGFNATEISMDGGLTAGK
ncbi:MAG: SDR family oxidoreductase [Proteobacteria bacterium]|nr:SDR family oxidoreductase [Pseudomonadota bacterium]MBU4286893.1 SDR family oxidoreductase [Pseudomonadota bacterium]MBU4415012.1 SDR family oxidoreductase [Pseudomonadota bacterium]MCG2758581.1 SDR family oxidoreductase [Desulfobacteraceae bacterium]